MSIVDRARVIVAKTFRLPAGFVLTPAMQFVVDELHGAACDEQKRILAVLVEELSGEVSQDVLCRVIQKIADV